MSPRHVDEPFDPVLNVRRNMLMRDMLMWVAYSSPSFRLRSVVGSAGSGKSWFMADLYQELQDRNPPITVWWMNLSANPIHPFSGDPEPGLHRQEGFDTWLTKVSGQPFSHSADFSARLEYALNHFAGEGKIIILVDGFDEIASVTEHHDWVEEQVLATAFRNKRVRLVVARRDDYGLTHPNLRWNDELCLLPGFEDIQCHQQIAHRYAARAERSVAPQDHVQDMLAPFVGENPFINTCLFERLMSPPVTSLTWEDRMLCAQRALERAGLSLEIFYLLMRLVDALPKHWTAKELVYVNLSIDDPILEPLFQSGIVSHVKDTQRYRVDAGIYKLLKNPSQPNVPPTQPTGSQPPSPPRNGIQWR